MQRKCDQLARDLELSGLFFLALDLSGRITGINLFAADLLGYEPDELLGRGWIERFIPQGDRQTSDQIAAGEEDPAVFCLRRLKRRDDEEHVIA